MGGYLGGARGLIEHYPTVFLKFLLNGDSMGYYCARLGSVRWTDY